MRVVIPSALHSYTARQRAVEVSAGTVGEMLSELDRRFPGLRFRLVDEQGALRPHVRVTVNAEVVASLDARLAPADDVAIIMAFSGG